MTQLTRHKPVPAPTPEMIASGWIEPIDIRIRINLERPHRKVYTKHLDAVLQRLIAQAEAQLESHRYPYEIESIEGTVRYGYVQETYVDTGAPDVGDEPEDATPAGVSVG